MGNQGGRMIAGNEGAADFGSRFLSFVAGGLTAGRVPFASGAATLDDDAALVWDDVNKRLGIGGTPSFDLDIVRSASGATVEAAIRNTSNTATSKALLLIQVAGATADDPFTTWTISGVQSYSAGIDNSVANDPWKLSSGTVLGTTDILVLGSTAAIGINMFPGGGANGYLLNFIAGASGELPANFLQFSSIGGTTNFGFTPQGDTGAAGRQMVFAYFNQTQFWSALEYANVASGKTTLDLIKSGGIVGIGRTLTASADLIFNPGALATNAVAGFLCIPGGAGTPTGTPTNAGAGRYPLYWDSTNKKMYVYDSGAAAWKGGTTPGIWV